MMQNNKIFLVIGTRPEAIKMYPIIKEIQKSKFSPIVIHTGQHKDMLDLHFKEMNIITDFYLNKNEEFTSHIKAISAIITSLQDLTEKIKPCCIVAQGDTNSVLAASLASYYNKVPFAHVEAGLRSKNINEPFPEEINRILSDKMSSFMFCPTDHSKNNLLDEGFDPDKIFTVGNTIVDVILEYATQIKILKRDYFKILVTMHRRENCGENIIKLCNALLNITNANKKIHIMFSVHQNPSIKNTVYNYLDNIPRITLTKPIPHREFIAEIINSDLILTDSGGIQEEVTTFGKSAFILRNATERPEATWNSNIKIIGNESDAIVQQTLGFFQNYQHKDNIDFNYTFGDGNSAKKIISILEDNLLKNS